LFFVPFLKFILFALLALLPTQQGAEPMMPIDPPEPDSELSSWLPHNALGSAALAVTVAALIGCGLAAISITWQNAYLGGLFIGAPFVIGFLATLLHETHGPRRLRE
jgi:asparagine N-glycosylation enzyme membrane subunit Stt3